MQQSIAELDRSGKGWTFNSLAVVVVWRLVWRRVIAQPCQWPARIE